LRWASNAQPENVAGSRWERHRVRTNGSGKGPLRDCPGCPRCRDLDIAPALCAGC